MLYKRSGEFSQIKLKNLKMNKPYYLNFKLIICMIRYINHIVTFKV